jgi:hypothetical protein
MERILTASQKVQLLRDASSFVISAYYKYTSFLMIRKPCIWNFLLCRLNNDFLRRHIDYKIAIANFQTV